MSTRLASQPRSVQLHDVISVVVAGLFWLAAMAIVTPAIRTPAHVEQVTIDNPHPWLAHVAVTDQDRDGWVGVGGVDREDQHSIREVLDQGDTWIFRFTYAGQSAETQLSRDQLEQADWQVTVPDQLADRLRTAGTPETPP